MRHLRAGGRRSGFTFLELMVTIAILGILSGIAVPNYLAYMPKARVNGAARMVMVDLMAARMKAVKMNKRTKVFYIDNHRYKICDDANGDKTVGCSAVLEEGDVQLRDIQLEYPDVTLSSTNNPIFSPRGTATNLATVRLQNAGGSKEITISIAGRVKIN